MEIILVKKLLNYSSSSNSSSDSSDSDDEILIIAKAKRKLKDTCPLPVKRSVFDKYNLDDFKNHFGLSRTVIETFLSELQIGTIEVKRGRSEAPIIDCMLLTLWILGNQESFRSCGDRFSFAKGHLHKLFNKMCKIICSKAKKYIVWPKENEAKQNITKFDKLHGNKSFPNVFGCVGGTHIAIPAPLADDSYHNCKGFYSIQLQGICNANREFIDVFCGWPGSSPEAMVWQNSPIYEKLAAHKDEMLPSESYLLADTTYPLDTFLMVPFYDNGYLTKQQKFYNQRLNCTRVLIGQTMARLKGIFQRLKYLNLTNLSYAKYIIFSCCILHNIIIQNQEDFKNFEVEPDEDKNNKERTPTNKEANGVRNNIMNNL